MPRVGKTDYVIGGLAIAAIACLVASHAHAQDAPPLHEFSITPYLWAPGVTGHLGAAADIPPVPVDSDFPGAFNKLDGFFMIQAEARYDRFGVLGDYVTFSISGDHNVTFQNLPALSGNIELSSHDATLAGFWRAYQSDRFTADLLAGARYTEAKSSVTVSVGSRTASGESSIDGWDPIVGARGTFRTGQRGSLAGYVDFGGGSFADSVWQAIGTYNWRFTDHITGAIGWRAYGVNLSRGDNRYDITLSGPLLGARFRFY